MEALMDVFRSAVRPVVTLVFCGAFIYGFLAQLISADAFLGIAVLILKYWFDSREVKGDDTKNHGTNQKI